MPELSEDHNQANCFLCDERPATTELVGKVLVCDVCKDDPDVRSHVQESWG